MKRRTYIQVAAEQAAAERVGVMQLAAKHRYQVGLMVPHALSAEDAELLGDRITTFAHQIASGMHLGGDGPEARRAVRAALRAAGCEPGRRA